MKPRSYGPFPYSLISRRPPLKWPNGARVALWVVPNIESFSLLERPGGLGPGKIPDIPPGPFATMETGSASSGHASSRRYGIRATVALNSDICINHPAIIEEGCRAGGNGWGTIKAIRGG
jgi:hypothetical protein